MALILDTGPILAALDADDADHAACRRLLLNTTEVLLIPAPVLVEADYWLTRRVHHLAFASLLRDIDDGGFAVEPLEMADYRRARELVERFADARVGFVDAAVLAVVERLGEPKLATLDRRHFGLLRPRHVDSLLLLPD
ncbi:MAG: PIN domain-containing protein [Chloroflexota bacterium]